MGHLLALQQPFPTQDVDAHGASLPGPLWLEQRPVVVRELREQVVHLGLG
jgi:hypothetical protein